MAEVVRRAGQILQPWAMAVGIEGATMFGFDYVLKELKKQKFYTTIKKTLKNYTEPVLAIGVSLVSLAIAYAQLPDMITRAIRVIGSWGVYKALLRLIGLEPVVMATDTSTIEAWNLGGTKPVELWIDGTKQTINATTDSKGYVKISLTTPLSEESHTILVHTGDKAGFTDEYVA